MCMNNSWEDLAMSLNPRVTHGIHHYNNYFLMNFQYNNNIMPSQISGLYGKISKLCNNSIIINIALCPLYPIYALQFNGN